MKKLLWFSLSVLMALTALGACTKDNGDGGGDSNVRPEKFGDDLFIKFTDPKSGVVSYQFRNEVLDRGACNTQSNYYVTKAMTDDERYFYLAYSSREKNGNAPSEQATYVVDLKTGKMWEFPKTSGYPYIDPEEDVFYYLVLGASSGGVRDSGQFYKKDLKTGEFKALAKIPKSVAPTGSYINRAVSHISLTQDRQKVFLDAVVGSTFIQGMLNLYTGDWEEWGRNKDWHLTHALISPVNDDEVLIAADTWDLSDGTTIKVGTDEHGWFRRMNLMTHSTTKNEKTGGYSTIRTIQPGEDGGATHEGWCADGNWTYWCSGGVHLRNLRSSQITTAWTKGVYEYNTEMERATHCNYSIDRNYVVYDDDYPWGPYTQSFYRGSPWRVHFINRKTGKIVDIYSALKPITTIGKQSTIHPDPHPHFVCNDKYIVCTAADGKNEDGTDIEYGGYGGYLHWSITPVDQLIQLTK